VEGTEQLIAALNRVRENLEPKRVAEVVLEACKPTAQAMAEGCPVRTGRTKAGIQARLLEDGPAVVVAMGPHREQWWARGLEFGTATRPGLGFLRSGFDGDENQLKERIRKGIADLMTQGVSR
jgi:HK97 gp10 family phage protein